MLEPATVQGEATFHVQQKWKAQKDESLYGLGQMQFGSLDIKGLDVDLWQNNTNVVVPFLVSSNGYGNDYLKSGPRWSEINYQM